MNSDFSDFIRFFPIFRLFPTFRLLDSAGLLPTPLRQKLGFHMKNIVKRKSTLSPDEYHPFSLFWANNGFLARFPLFGKTQKRLFLRNSGRDRVRCQCGKVLFSVRNQFASSSRLYPCESVSKGKVQKKFK